MLVALAQTDCVLGDVDANLAEAARLVERARANGAELVVFPELILHGYMLGQLDRDTSLRANDPRLAALSKIGPDVLAGFYEDGGLRRYNSAAYLSEGGVVQVHRKLYLPTYLAWEERKHAAPGQAMRAFDSRFGRLATLICNDLWQPVLPWLAVQDGASVLLVPTNSAIGSQVRMDTAGYWADLVRLVARMQQSWVVFVNRVGQEGDAQFWGGSRVVDPGGATVVEAPAGEPALVYAEIDVDQARRARRAIPLVSEARLSLVLREVSRLMDEGGDG